MSGGSFEYNCYRISQFAEDLRQRIDNNDVKDEYGYADELPPETIALLERCYCVINLAGKLAHHVEWLYSGDHGPESFAELADKDFQQAKEEV